MILSDFTCPYHGRFEALADAEAESHPCGSCSVLAPWSPSPVRGRVRLGEVERGAVARPDSPMMLDTRSLGEGEPYADWRARRDKMYQERRWAERKDVF